MTAAAAYEALTWALADQTQLCLDDDRFTDDSTADDSELAELCAICPVRAACRAYRLAASPPAGFWAGERRRAYNTRKEAS